MSDETPKIPYWHLWRDEDGISRHSRCHLTEFEMQSIGGGAAAQWLGRKTTDRMTVMVTVLPVGWVGDWHENPKPQWIIPLSGKWYVEAMDGSRAEMGVGELAFGGDQGCKTVDGKTGHMSGTVGDVPAVLMIVQWETPLDAPRPCGFK
jgi:hypothetical protein